MRGNEKIETEVKFVFEPTTAPQKNFYIRSIHAGTRKLAKLFPVAPRTVTVHVFRNRAAFLKAINKREMPEWIIAYVPPKNTSRMYVLDNKEKITAKKTIRQVFLHELAHLYTNTLNPNLPDWLKEGISIYVAEQIFNLSISTANWKRIAHGSVPFKGVSWEYAAKHNGYSIAGLLVLFFVRRYGWTKFIIAITHRRSMHFSAKSIPLYFGEKLEWLIVDFKKQFVK